MGVPVVATAAGGPLDIVENGVTGILVPPNDDVSLAAAIEDLLANPKKATSLASAAVNNVQTRFTLEKTATVVQATYESLFPLSAGASS